MKVFLGGTVNGSKWRSLVKEKLTINYFDPVVSNWTDAAYERELSERRYCDYVLYVLTPKMTGFYAVAEVTDDSYHRPDRTIYCYLPTDGGDKFTKEQIEEFEYLGKTVTSNGGIWLSSLEEVITFLNSAKTSKSLEQSTHYDAFISYGRQESQHFADSISNGLNNQGFSVFRDLNEIPLIVESEEFILKSILHSDNFIYIISPNTVRSEYCNKELGFAIKYNKRIIPVVHNRLGKDIQYLDDIVAKKQIIEIRKAHEHLDEVISEIKKVLETDREYLKSHTEYLFRAKNWDFNGRKQADLLYGSERKSAIAWLKNKSEHLVPLHLQKEYVEASKKMSVFYLPILWLNKKTHNFTHLKWFDKTVLVISLINPIAMSAQIPALLNLKENGVNSNDDGGVSLTMWVMLFGIHVTLVLASIKDKDLRLFLSAGISGIVSSTIILILLFS
ncbi:MAG: TIR domain-containing protein [Crocinitomix sp.]|nr:TIR domain-containing protein [Crocinitomix sp.]